MHIADTHIAISAFVCMNEEVGPGKWVRMPKATAFLTTIKGDPFWTGYVVTAAHVIEGAGNRLLYLRVNTEDGFDDIEIQREEWFIHDNADVAIVRVQWTGEKPYKLYSIYPEEFVRGDFSMQVPGALTGARRSPMPVTQPVVKVGTGDQVSIIGLFAEHYGRSMNLPIVRAGTIARMPSAPVKYRHPGGTYSEQLAYLIEIHSHGGLSGSPVYVHHRAVVVLTQIDVPVNSQSGQKVMEKIWVQDPEGEFINFLGVVSGHFDIAQSAEMTGDIDGSVTVAINAGIAVVTPAEAVRQLLWREDVVEDRLQENEAAKKAQGKGSRHLPKERAIFHYKSHD